MWRKKIHGSQRVTIGRGRRSGIVRVRRDGNILSADGYDELEREITAQAGQDKELALAMIAAPAAKDPAPRRRPVKKRPVAKKTEKDSPAKKEVASKTEEEKPKAVEKKPEAVKSYDDGVQLLDDGSKSKKKKGGEYELLDIQ